MKRVVLRNLCLFILVIGLLSCANIRNSAESRIQSAKASLNAHNWQAFEVETGEGPIWAAKPSGYKGSDTLWIFIEGDGLSWINRRVPSANPTPSNPVGLKLALQNVQGPSMYLGRPCQFILPLPAGCNPQKWLSHRFSKPAIKQVAEAIDLIVLNSGTKQLHLVGFSGGAAIAMQIATHRTDVASVITVAGNLDPDKWARFHRLTPLVYDSAESEDYRVGTRYLHLYGENDTVIPLELTWEYPKTKGVDVTNQVLPYTHQCCWAQTWNQVVSLWVNNGLED